MRLFSIKGLIFYAANVHRTRVGNISCVSLHAEVNVLLKALKSFSKNSNLKSKTKLPPSTICVVRLMRDKKDLPEYRNYRFGISKPCMNCEKQLHKYNVIKIYYTDIINGEEVLCEMRKK